VFAGRRPRAGKYGRPGRLDYAGPVQDGQQAEIDAACEAIDFTGSIPYLWSLFTRSSLTA